MNVMTWAPVIAGGTILLVLAVILARGKVSTADGPGAERVEWGKLKLQTSRMALLFLAASAMVSLPLILAHLKPEPKQQTPVCPPPAPDKVTLYINGEVLDSGDRGLADARIQVLDSHQKVVFEKTADEDGLFGFPLEVRTQGEQITIKTFKENYFQQQFVIGPSAAVKLHAVLMPRPRVAHQP
jgi:hypothetical protein